MLGAATSHPTVEILFSPIKKNGSLLKQSLEPTNISSDTLARKSSSMEICDGAFGFAMRRQRNCAQYQESSTAFAKLRNFVSKAARSRREKPPKRRHVSFIRLNQDVIIF